MQAIKKISLKTVFGSVQDIKEHAGKAIVRVFGSANKIQMGESTYGEFTALKGKFRAINLITGEEFEAGTLFMPDAATDLVAGALGTDGASSVEFAFDIMPRIDEKSATGYSYGVIPLVEPTEDDPLEKMKASLPPLPGKAAPKLEDKGEEKEDKTPPKTTTKKQATK